MLKRGRRGREGDGMGAARYLYGIVNSEKRESFGKIGIGNSEVYTVQHEDVGAAVSDIPEDYRIEVEEAKTHEKAIRKIMASHTIIPMSFGVVAKDEAEIRNILRRARMKFKSILAKVEDRLQVNVTVSLDRNVIAEILGEDKEIQTLTAKAKRNKAEQNIRLELGSMVKTALDRRKDRYARDVEHFLGAVSEGFREGKIADEYAVMNGSFLVNRKQEQEFYRRLDELEKRYEKKLTCLAVGPLPPYDFAEIRIGKMDLSNVEEARKAFGLGKEATLSEVNSAYEELARRYHPDLNHDDPLAEEKFKRIRDAYEVLTKYCEHYLCSLEKSKVEETLIIQGKTG